MKEAVASRVAIFWCFFTVFVLPLVAEADEVKEHEIALTKGQYETELGNYDAAVKYLTEALRIKPDDHVTMVSLGIAYSRAERYAEAKEVLAKVVAADPANARARYELGVVLAHLKQYGEANKLLATVTALTANEDLTDQAKELIEGLQQAEQGPAPALNVTGGMQYDSNVILEPNSPTTPQGRKGDWRGILSLTGTYPFLQTERRGAELRYQFYQSVHLELEDYNVQQHDLSVGGRYQVASDAVASAQYAFVTSYVGGEHYSAVNRLRLGLATTLTTASRTALSLAVEDRTYYDSGQFPANSDRSALSATAGVAHTLLFSRDTSLSFAYAFQRDDADAERWDVTANKGDVVGRTKLGKYAVFCGVGLSDWKYGASPSALFPDRHDRRWDLMAGFYRDVSRKVRISLANQYVMNDSNLSAYKYDRNIVGLFAEVKL